MRRRLALGLTMTMLGTAATLAVTGAPASADPHYNSITSASPANRSWMTRLPDDTGLASLSIPGTHDSLALCGAPILSPCGGGITGSITKTQENHGLSAQTLSTQLDAGIRAVDIRVRVDSGAAGLSFTVHHGAFYQNATFTDVLTAIRGFLTANPGETVLMHLKAECTAEAFSCVDADGYGNDEWRLKVLRSYLEGRAYTGEGDGWRPATAWGEMFWAPSVSGTSQADTPTLGAVRGKIVLLGYRGVRGGIYGGYGLRRPYPAGQSSDEFVQDAYDVPGVGDIAGKWEKVRAHLRRTNGVFDSRRPGETAYVHRPDALYVNYTSGAGAGAHPYTVAGGIGAATGVNRFLYECLRDEAGRCPEFYPGREPAFGGRESMDRTGVVMMDFPGGGLIDEIVGRNVSPR